MRPASRPVSSSALAPSPRWCERAQPGEQRRRHRLCGPVQRQQCADPVGDGQGQRPHDHALARAGRSRQRIDDRHAEPGAHQLANRHRAVRLYPQAPCDAGRREACIDLTPVGVSLGQADEGLVGEVLQCEALARREGMLGWQYGHLVDLQHGLHPHARQGRGQFRQAEVKALLAHPGIEQWRFGGCDGDTGCGALGQQSGERLRQQGVAQRRQAQHIQGGVVVPTQRLGSLDDTPQPLEAALHLVEQRMCPGRGLEPAAFAVEQRVAEQLLQPGEVAAQGGLGGVQQSGGASDAAGGHDRAEDLDVAVLDIHIRSGLSVDNSQFD
mmetsp:Transcript_37518/g.87479  ORF Transcript_37518/g.87479 Transcript_37518/m.87479 type:complete len:326 (-) Transcript_37518:680-1657(-)